MKSDASAPAYMSGFANEFATEALAGALPAGRNSPQQPPLGLYVEKFSGTAFTAPARANYRSWFYRIRPSVVHGDFRPIDAGLIRTAPLEDAPLTPNQLCWSPQPIPDAPTDFVEGLMTVAGNGNARMQLGLGIHVYCANQSMEDRFFYDADGELLIVPQQGRVRLHTECGVLAAGPGEIAIVPRGMKFRVVLVDGAARGWVCENYGRKLELPERGPIGSDGLANRRDFETPVAAFEEREGELELVAKFSGRLFACRIDHSPLDVVAWHGNLAPCRYDLRRFNTIGSISYDHPDPSIFTVLTSQSDTPGTANMDLAIFPPRWLVMENTFRPPWFHRNVMSEYMGLIYGEYDAKIGGALVPGGATLHNCMSAHGPDRASWEKASAAELVPQKIDEMMAFMFESRLPIQPTRFALENGTLRSDYRAGWQDLPKTFAP